MTKHKKSLVWEEKVYPLTYDMVDLENKLIRANKRITKWRGRYNIASGNFIEAIKMVNDGNMRLDIANLKQKKAWIAFYIATILYIVGIVIII